MEDKNEENKAILFLEEEGFVMSILEDEEDGLIVFSKELKNWVIELGFVKGGSDYMISAMIAKEKTIGGSNKETYWLDVQNFDNLYDGIKQLLEKSLLIDEAITRYLNANVNVKAETFHENIRDQNTMNIYCTKCNEKVLSLDKNEVLFTENKNKISLKEMIQLDSKLLTKEYNKTCYCYIVD